MLTYRDFITGLRKLEIDHSRPVMAHASLSAFKEVRGGAQSMLGALCSLFKTVIMPTFTYKTMITPEVGPPGNAIIYGSGKDANRMAEMFRPDMPADKLMGVVAESLRQHPKAYRSVHPILSFAGVNAGHILERQTLNEPLLHIQTLIDKQGWVLLLGVDQTVNTSIHYGEQLAGRKQFIRWALTSKGIIPCQRFPGCSYGFEDITPLLQGITRRVKVGEGKIVAVPLESLINTVCWLVKKDPVALLCTKDDCERCNTVRAAALKH